MALILCVGFAGVKLIFFTVAIMDLHFGFVLKTGFLLQRYFSYCWAVHRFILPSLPPKLHAKDDTIWSGMSTGSLGSVVLLCALLIPCAAQTHQGWGEEHKRPWHCLSACSLTAKKSPYYQHCSYHKYKMKSHTSYCGEKEFYPSPNQHIQLFSLPSITILDNFNVIC